MDRELRDLHRGARRERAALVPDAGPCEPSTSEDEHDCLDNLGDGGNDPMTPDHIVHYECQRCGEWWEYDTETDEHEVDR